MIKKLYFIVYYIQPCSGLTRHIIIRDTVTAMDAPLNQTFCKDVMCAAVDLETFFIIIIMTTITQWRIIDAPMYDSRSDDDVKSAEIIVRDYRMRILYWCRDYSGVINAR